MNNSLETLNDPQRQAVETIDGAVLVIAGAGSGKTRVLTERIAHIVRDHGVSPFNVLAFTFTNKAAREMKGRIERACPGIFDLLWVGTFHSTGVRILRRHGERIGVGRDFSIYDSDDSLNLVKGIISRSIMDGRVVKSPRALRDRISRFKNELITPQMAAEEASNNVDTRIASMYAEYEKELRRANALDFDDLIGRVVELFSIDEDARLNYARRFKYILVDEFQDTNPIQMAMIDALASYHGNLFVVGDDDQSIYSWRGAKVEHILDFEHVYPKTTLIRLEQNYRSTKTILEAANHVIAHNVGRKSKTLWTDGAQGENIKLLVSMDEEGEAVNVIQAVREHIGAGVSLKEIAILYRTNAQSRAIEDVLKMSSIPYQIIGSVRFYERMEVRDILAYCKVLVNPADTVNLKRIINVPKRGIGKTTFERLDMVALDRDKSIIDVLRSDGGGISSAAASRCRSFLEVFARLEARVASEVAPRAIEFIVEELKYYEYLNQNYPDSEGRIENVEELISAAHSFAESAENKSLAAFLEEIALVADVDALDLESGQLTLMTLHNAKGLEFECVFITGIEEGLFPHFNSIDDEAAVEEERRLFYVGMTRSKMHLYLSMAGMRRRMGQIDGSVPSRFLYEVPEHCLDAPIERRFRGGDSRESAGAGSLWNQWGDSGASTAQAHPDYESFSQEIQGYQVGMRIRHDNYGSGVVRRVEGSGEQTRVTVIFDRGDERKFLAQFAPMRPL